MRSQWSTVWTLYRVKAHPHLRRTRKERKEKKRATKDARNGRRRRTTGIRRAKVEYTERN